MSWEPWEPWEPYFHSLLPYAYVPIKNRVPRVPRVPKLIKTLILQKLSLKTKKLKFHKK